MGISLPLHQISSKFWFGDTEKWLSMYVNTPGFKSWWLCNLSSLWVEKLPEITSISHLKQTLLLQFIPELNKTGKAVNKQMKESSKWLDLWIHSSESWKVEIGCGDRSKTDQIIQEIWRKGHVPPRWTSQWQLSPTLQLMSLTKT